MDKLFVGMDVAKDWIDIAIAGCGEVKRIGNRAEAIAAWLSEAAKANIALVAFEPTGGHERKLRRCLVEAGISFARVHPNQVVAFRQQRGVRAKTDRIDARLLADFAADELARRGLAPMIEGEEVLRELAVRRRQLLATLHAERCRRELAESPIVRDSLAATIAALESSLAAVDAFPRPDARQLRGGVLCRGRGGDREMGTRNKLNIYLVKQEFADFAEIVEPNLRRIRD